MRQLFRSVYHSIDSYLKTKFWPIMASLSDCGPTAQKRLKLDSEDIKIRTDEDNGWRSKLMRNFDEIDVGISEFIGNFRPFEGILKNRYEDFVVHEISKNGQIVRLMDNSEPEDEISPVLDIYEVLDDNTIDQIKQLIETEDNEVISEVEVIDDEKITSCEEVVIVGEKTDSSEEVSQRSEETVDSKPTTVKISVNGLSKFERTRIHKTIKDNFEELETLTIDEGSDKYIAVKRFDKNSVKRRPNQWPKEKGEYIHFVLYKENKETHQSVTELALKMNVSAKNFNIAGTKDKRAITTQMVSAWKVPPKKIWQSSKRCNNIEVGHFEFNKEPLSLGDLNGNHFDIVLRDVKCEDRTNADLSLESLKAIGFINYYGMQRFGYLHSKPYEIGISILRQKWEEVVNKILTPKPHDLKLSHRPDAMTFNECMNLWHETKNPQKVYKKFPFKWSPEGTLLKGLTRVGPKDFYGAICAGMVRSQRLLYLHCYQSYIWNKAASFRIRTYGLKVVIGDLLLLEDGNQVDDNLTDDNSVKDMNRNIVIADEDNIKTASIYDIVLPLIGSENLMPKNSVSEFMESLMAEEEVTIEMYRNLPKEWCVFGTYRKLFARPENFDHQWVPYEDPNISLIDTDLTLMNKKKQSIVESTGDPIADKSENNRSDGQKLALKISMSLPTSCYATMAFRQMTRTETTVLESKEWLKTKYNL